MLAFRDDAFGLISRYPITPAQGPRNSERARSAWPGALSAHTCSVTPGNQTRLAQVRPDTTVNLNFTGPCYALA